MFFTGGGASPATAVVKTLPSRPEPVPPLKPLQNTPGTVISSASPPKSGAPPPSQTEVASSPPAKQNPARAAEDTQTSRSSPPIKIPPPLVSPKPQSPVNVVSPMTQTPPVLPPPPVATLPLTPTKPAVPIYVPVSSPVSICVAPTPAIFSPQVLQTSSLSPFADGVATPTKGPSSGRATPSTGLRQGIPQKPYTFLDEKAR